jgi:hypothetical protein
MFGWLRNIFGSSPSAARIATDTSPGGVFTGLRSQAFSLQRNNAGIPAPPSNAPIWGVLMELGLRKGTATMLALADGTTSLYLSTGGGVIGGQGHESVRKANAALIATANELRENLQPVTSLPVPEPGHTIFYARTDACVLSAGGQDRDLSDKSHPLSRLFHAGHAVLTELRLISEKPG